MRDFKKLEVWRIARELNKLIYVSTRDFPKDEIYGLTSQIRRAVVSIASNIAEGCGRRTSKDFVQFLHNAMGSIKEVECQVFLSKDLGYLASERFNEILEELDKLGRKLSLFIKHVETEGVR
jgi:four helix bundle protein